MADPLHPKANINSKFSIPILIHFLCDLQGEFVPQSSFLSSQYFFYFYDLNVCFRGDTVMRN